MTRNGASLEHALKASRHRARREVIFFVNGYDPEPDLTLELLRVLANHRVTCVELCVPFPRSITDGPVIRASHARALAAGATLDGVLAIAKRAVSELDIQIVLLADYAHSVAPIGLSGFIAKVKDSGASASLVHALPASLRRSYVDTSRAADLGRVTTFFVTSAPEVRRAAYEDAEGFVYVVSQLGRTGGAGVGARVHTAIAGLRTETDRPLAVGFGVKSARDAAAFFEAGADAAIVGSAGVEVVARGLEHRNDIPREFDRFVASMLSAPQATDADNGALIHECQ